MKSKFLIISKDGIILEPSAFLKSAKGSNDFISLVNEEVFGKVGKKIGEPLYIKNANKLGFSWEKVSGIGFINYNYKAEFIKRLVKDYARSLVNQIGFPIYEVSGSNFFDIDHKIVCDYANLFGDRLFYLEDKEKKFVMSYDASYPQFNLASDSHIFEKNLPFAHFSLSDCYRMEQSGECMLLLRGRRFNMPDLHPYFANIKNAFEWYVKMEKVLVSSFKDLGREYQNVIKVSSIENFNKYENEIKQIAIRNGKDVLVEIKMDGADRYWIIDCDYSIIDAMGRSREIGCIQIDIGNASRLGIQFRDSDGSKQNPVIIHAAIPGGIERYIYMCVDDMNLFPIWLHPIQIRLVPISDKYIEFCEKLRLEYQDRIRIDIDDRKLPVGKRLKRAKEDLVPNVFLVGEKEQSKNLDILESKFSEIIDLSKNRPFYRFDWPHLVSKLIN